MTRTPVAAAGTTPLTSAAGGTAPPTMVAAGAMNTAATATTATVMASNTTAAAAVAATITKTTTAASAGFVQPVTIQTLVLTLAFIPAPFLCDALFNKGTANPLKLIIKARKAATDFQNHHQGVVGFRNVSAHSHVDAFTNWAFAI
jgi:hypothetical protein